jgi:hypothetical protein
MMASEFEPAWLNGWQRLAEGWMLEAVGMQEVGWVTKLLPATWLQERRRLFEPSAPPYARLSTSSMRLRVADLSQLSPLLEPGKLLRPLVPAARHTKHAVYVTPQEGMRVFVPAALLLPELWMWTAGALQALLTPNSLSLYLSRSGADGQMHVQASGLLSRLGPSDTTLRRLCWLAQCGDAQASWSSVLTFAHDGALRLRLPRASLDAWARGVELSTGVLISELWAVNLSFDLPQIDCEVSIAGMRQRCPPPPIRQTGFVSF